MVSIMDATVKNIYIDILKYDDLYETLHKNNGVVYINHRLKNHDGSYSKGLTYVLAPINNKSNPAY